MALRKKCEILSLAIPSILLFSVRMAFRAVNPLAGTVIRAARASVVNVLLITWFASSALLNVGAQMDEFALPLTPSEPNLSEVQLQGGKIHFVLRGRVEGKYVIETSEELRHWTPISTNILANSGSVAVQVQSAATNRSAFFRAREDLSAVIFLDRFDRADSPVIGGNWLETDQSNLLSLRSGSLRLTSSTDRAAYLRATGGAQVAVKLTLTLEIEARNNTEVIQIGTRGGGAISSDNPYRDCFGFAILPAFGVQPNDTAFQGTITPFVFDLATPYLVEMLVFADASRELRVWKSGDSRPALPTLFVPAQGVIRATGSRYQIGFDSGSSQLTDIFIDDFRVEPFSNSAGTTMVLADSFTRPDSPTVGGAWQETDPSNLLSIDAGVLKLTSNADRSAYLRASGGPQTGIMMSFTLNIVTTNTSQVLVIGTKGGSLVVDTPYRDCFGFAILPSLGVIATDTTLQGETTPFEFEEGGTYQVELLFFADNSRELRIWKDNAVRPEYATAFSLPRLVTLATGSKYNIGFNSGSAAFTSLSIDDFRIQSITNKTGTAQLLFDPFERADSGSVNGPWKETDPDNLLSIQNKTLRLSASADRSAYLRASSITQTGVQMTFALSIISTNQTQVIAVGSQGGGGKDNPYRDCFGFLILPSRGLQANDTAVEGTVTPYAFLNGRTYRVEVRLLQNKSREIRVWPEKAARPSTPTLAVASKPTILAKGMNYQLGFDSGSAQPTEFRVDDFRVEKITP